jgi:hypothetical protein
MMNVQTQSSVVQSPEQVAGLPVAQIKLSHDLSIDPDKLTEQDVPTVVPVYPGMSPGDVIAFIWQGYYQGVPEPPWKRSITVNLPGRPLVLGLPNIEVLIVDGGHADISYQLTSAQDGSTTPSPVQTLQVTQTTTPLLAAAAVVDHVPGQPLDPSDYPEGIVVQITAYPGMSLGDQVLLYGDGANRQTSFVQSVQVEASHVQDAKVEFEVAQEWLLLHVESDVSLFYQFARVGAAQSSEAVVLTVHKAAPLPPPIIERASAEGDPGEYHGFLPALQATSGVYVKVPESVPLGAGDKVEVHWQGHPAGGQFIAVEPYSAQDVRRFLIPASAVPANMGTGDSKRFDVFYRLIPASGAQRDSIPFGLRIVPLDTARYPTIQWDRLGGAATLSLQTVPANGEELRVDSWPFMGAGQLVTFEATGVTATGAPTRIVVRDALPVTAQELAAKAVRGKLALTFLQGLKLNEFITLTASVSFDGGETRTSFNHNQGVRLVP